jgi:hypothetical protein
MLILILKRSNAWSVGENNNIFAIFKAAQKIAGSGVGELKILQKWVMVVQSYLKTMKYK